MLGVINGDMEIRPMKIAELKVMFSRNIKSRVSLRNSKLCFWSTNWSWHYLSHQSHFEIHSDIFKRLPKILIKSLVQNRIWDLPSLMAWIWYFTGCLHDTWATFTPKRVHSGSLSWLYICLHDTTTKCYAGASHPCMSSLRLLYRGENLTPVQKLAVVSCKRKTTTCFSVKLVCR